MISSGKGLRAALGFLASSDNVDENSPDDFMKNVSKGNQEFNNKLKENIEFYENQYKR